MSVNVFSNGTKSLPKRDEMIVRVSMEELEIGGRKSHLPAENKSGKMAIRHVGGSSGMGSN